MGVIRRHWLTLTGLVIAAVGAATLVLARTEQFGWASYSPLQSSVTTPKVWVFDQPQAGIGLLLLLVGVAFIGAGVGYRAGHATGSPLAPR